MHWDVESAWQRLRDTSGMCLFSNNRILEVNQNMDINCHERIKVMKIQDYEVVKQHSINEVKRKKEMNVTRIGERMKREWPLIGRGDCKDTPKNLLDSLNISGNSLESVTLSGFA